MRTALIALQWSLPPGALGRLSRCQSLCGRSSQAGAHLCTCCCYRTVYCLLPSCACV